MVSWGFRFCQKLNTVIFSIKKAIKNSYVQIFVNEDHFIQLEKNNQKTTRPSLSLLPDRSMAKSLGVELDI